MGVNSFAVVLIRLGIRRDIFVRFGKYKENTLNKYLIFNLKL